MLIKMQQTISNKNQIPLIELQKLKKIGKGGFGEVYQGKWNLITEVAIKELFMQDLPENVKIEFAQEIQIMLDMRHPNIIQIFGYCPNPLSVVMELMSCSLFELLHSKKDLPWSQRYKISLDLISGLIYMHNINIIHRDLKSLNILLDNNLRAKITDFGLSQVKADKNTQISAKEVGTIKWMAPELFGENPQPSPESDIFALGVIMWEIASRKIPFEEVDNQELKKEQLKVKERLFHKTVHRYMEIQSRNAEIKFQKIEFLQNNCCKDLSKKVGHLNK